MSDSDRPFFLWKVRHISLNLSIEIYLTFLNQLKNGNCRHGLGDRSQPVGRTGSSGYLVLQVSVSESLNPHVSIFDKSDGQAGNMFQLHLLLNEFLVDAKLACVLAGTSTSANRFLNRPV